MGHLLEIFSLIATVLLGVITIILTVKHHKRVALEYAVSSTRLIKNEVATIEGLEITFYGNRISELVASKIVFTNIGNVDITPDTFYPSAQLELTTTERFLGTAIVGGSNNSATVENITSNKVRIKFSYLHPSQNFTITAFHSGPLTVLGDLIDGKLISK